jgi:hypothetical protein
MLRLKLEALAVTSFETTRAFTVEPIAQSEGCISPLCMTEGKECTTPWCQDKAGAA